MPEVNIVGVVTAPQTFWAASAVWQTSDTEEQVNKRTEERVW